MNMREQMARAIDDACIAYSKSHAGLGLRKWDTPGEIMADAVIDLIRNPSDEMVERCADVLWTETTGTIGDARIIARACLVAAVGGE